MQKPIYPIYLKNFGGEMQIKRISDSEHCLAIFAKRQGGHYECHTSKVKTVQSDLDYFEHCEPATEQEFIESVIQIADFNLKIKEYFETLTPQVI